MSGVGKAICGAWLAAASAASQADNCEPIRAQIEARFKAGGVVNFRVFVVDAAAASAGRVVGSCGNGTKRIVYVPGAASSGPSAPPSAATSPVKSRPENILTECKDGTVTTTGNCRK